MKFYGGHIDHVNPYNVAIPKLVSNLMAKVMSMTFSLCPIKTINISQTMLECFLLNFP